MTHEMKSWSVKQKSTELAEVLDSIVLLFLVRRFIGVYQEKAVVRAV